MEPPRSFDLLLTAPPERLVNLFYVHAKDPPAPRERRLARLARRFELHPSRFVCALGFNPAMRELPDVLAVLGFCAYEELADRRNAVFINDIYRHLSLDDVLAIYAAVRDDPPLVEVMQSLLARRLERIERRIEATVNSLVIERYKKEMRAIYNDGVAQIDFAEARLNRTDSGFRALVNEVGIITEAKLIPVGDIFFRDTVLPEEKRRLISKGLVPPELIRQRLEDRSIGEAERRMLEEELVAAKRRQ